MRKCLTFECTSHLEPDTFAYTKSIGTLQVQAFLLGKRAIVFIIKSIIIIDW